MEPIAYQSLKEEAASLRKVEPFNIPENFDPTKTFS